MTLEEAQGLLIQVVTELKPESRHAAGVPGASIAAALAKRGHRDLQHRFKFDKLSHFIKERCQPPLVVRRVPPLLDVLVDLASSEASSFPSETSARSTSAHNRRVSRVDPAIWRAVLVPISQPTFVDDEGVVAVGEEPAGGGYRKIERMPVSVQVDLLDEAATQLREIVKNDAIRQCLSDALAAAKLSQSPVLEFSKTMSALYWFSTVWNKARVNAVSEHVRKTTGVTPRESRSLTARVSPQMATSGQLQPPTREKLQASDRSVEDGLRGAVIEAIRKLNLRELLDLKLPVEATLNGSSRIKGT